MAQELIVSVFILFLPWKTPGTLATFIVVEGWTMTVPSVDDFRCILHTQGCGISILTVDH